MVGLISRPGGCVCVRERASRPRARALLQHKLESAITKTRARAFFASPAIACVRVRAAAAIIKQQNSCFLFSIRFPLCTASAAAAACVQLIQEAERVSVPWTAPSLRVRKRSNAEHLEIPSPRLVHMQVHGSRFKLGRYATSWAIARARHTTIRHAELLHLFGTLQPMRPTESLAK